MNLSYTEDHLVEQPAIQLMQHELGWEVVNCFSEWDGGVSELGRDGKREVVLGGRLKAALLALNPDLPLEAIEGAVEEISRDRTALSLVEAIRYGPWRATPERDLAPVRVLGCGPDLGIMRTNGGIAHG